MRPVAIASAAVAAAVTVRGLSDTADLACWSSPLQALVHSKPVVVCDAAKGGNDDDPNRTGLVWDEPEGPDCVGQSCVFTDRVFGGGITMISTRENAQTAAEFPAPPRLPATGPPPFVEAEIPGKGRGYVASRTIRRGESIMLETPTMIVQLGPPSLNLTHVDRMALYERAVLQLPPDARRRFLSQYGDSVNDKIDKNCFRMYLHNRDEGGDHLGCFPEVALMNHDCRPKCVFSPICLTLRPSR